MEENRKWGDLTQFQRYLIVGKVIDAMIYHAEALDEVITLLDSFEERGFVKSEFLTNDDFTEMQNNE